jgi:hypothetical protein
VIELLNQHLVFMTFHKDVTDRFCSKGAGSEVALSLAFDRDITWCWHDKFLFKNSKRFGINLFDERQLSCQNVNY